MDCRLVGGNLAVSMVTTLTYLVSSEEEVEFPGFGVHWQSTHEQRADLKNTKEFHINRVGQISAQQTKRKEIPGTLTQPHNPSHEKNKTPGILC